LEACKLALRKHDLSERSVISALLFGSRVKGFVGPKSDVDLIFLVRPDCGGPDFQYRRFHRDGLKIDSNVINIDILNDLCREDADWAYRLQHAQPVGEFTYIPELVSHWLQIVDQFIESPEACRFRLIRHIRDCKVLLKAIHHVQAGTTDYLLLEILSLAPLIYLNARGIVPYETGYPWDEALRIVQQDDSQGGRQYKRLTKTVYQSSLFQRFSQHGSFAEELKRMRDSARREVETFCGNIFAHSYGATLSSCLKGNLRLRARIAQLFTEENPEGKELAAEVTRWLGSIKRTPLGSCRPRRTNMRYHTRLRSLQTTEPRMIEYHPTLERLKVILPTGGCRVPTCTFCMLPLLARSKIDVFNFLSSLKRKQSAPVRQLTVYTDGSFFDDRELSQQERAAIATLAKEFKAEELLVESLPRFLNPETVGRVLEILQPECRLRIGIGVQSTNAQIRRHITSTPITQAELITLLGSRHPEDFCLRIFLMANKPLLSAKEDRCDLLASLKLLQQYLRKQDIVTINPLLPTHGTVLEGLWKSGQWRPLTIEEAISIEIGLGATNWNFQLQFGPSQTSTCTDVQLEPNSNRNSVENIGHRRHVNQVDSRSLPWTLLGGSRHRRSFTDRLQSAGPKLI
jgi:radical SAM enzyme (TIGR01210 family)